jgi:hypothetical protein
MASRQKLVVPVPKKAIEEMKIEIANELGIELGSNTSSYANGSVGGQIGGQITKNLVAMALQDLANQ